MKRFAWLKTSRLLLKAIWYVAQAVRTGLKSNPFIVIGLCKSIIAESVYNEALVVLLRIYRDR